MVLVEDMPVQEAAQADSDWNGTLQFLKKVNAALLFTSSKPEENVAIVDLLPLLGMEASGEFGDENTFGSQKTSHDGVKRSGFQCCVPARRTFLVNSLDDDDDDVSCVYSGNQ